MNNELSDFCNRADMVRAGKVTNINTAVLAERLHNMLVYLLLCLVWTFIVIAGQQPPSSMTPAILESKSGGLLVIGGSGGSMITSAVALVTQMNSACMYAHFLVCLHDSLLFGQAIMNHLWLGMTLKDAIATPIVFVDSKNNVNFEPGFDKVKKLHQCFQ